MPVEIAVKQIGASRSECLDSMRNSNGFGRIPVLKVHRTCVCGLQSIHSIPSTDIYRLDYNEDDQALYEIYCRECNRPLTLLITLFRNDNNYQVRCVGDQTARLEIDDDDLFDEIDIIGYLRDVVANEPDKVFEQAVSEINSIIMNSDDSKPAAQTLNRMIFNQIFTMFETYLSDRVIRLIRDDDKALGAILKYDGLEKKPIPFAAVFSAPDYVRNYIIQNLYKVSFHDLKKVNEIYEVVFGCGIFNDDIHKMFLYECVPIRHDCVHRNGKDISGNPHTITPEFIIQLLQSVNQCYLAIEAAHDRTYAMIYRR